MTSVNEGSIYYVTASFSDKEGVLDAPTSCRYRVDDGGSGEEVKDWTVLSPAQSVEIELGADINTLLDAEAPEETRVVTVEGSYGGEDKVTDDYVYRIINLRHYS